MLQYDFPNIKRIKITGGSCIRITFQHKDDSGEDILEMDKDTYEMLKEEMKES